MSPPHVPTFREQNHILKFVHLFVRLQETVDTHAITAGHFVEIVLETEQM